MNQRDINLNLKIFLQYVFYNDIYKAWYFDGLI